MKRIILLLVLGLLPFAANAAESKEKNAATGVKIKKVEGSAFKRILDQMWGKLRAYAPKLSTRAEAKRSTQIAGVRGAESTGSLIKPYWKGDRTNDPDYLQQLTAYNQAQKLADNGDLNKAAAAFKDFLTTYPKSSLRPNAQFALALAYSGAGDRQKGIAAMNGFLKEHPKHPLGPDARKMLAAIKQN